MYDEKTNKYASKNFSFKGTFLKDPKHNTRDKRVGFSLKKVRPKGATGILIFWGPKVLFLCGLKLHAQFHNPRTTPKVCGTEASGGYEKE